MNFEKVKKAINEVGFPIFVCCWLIYDKITVQTKLVETLNDLKIVIENLH